MTGNALCEATSIFQRMQARRCKVTMGRAELSQDVSKKFNLTAASPLYYQNRMKILTPKVTL
eukprot:12423485-Karenia_brevis.AAC.1